MNKIWKGDKLMAMSKALQAKQWWEGVSASDGVRCIVQPTWLDRARRRVTARDEKIDEDRSESDRSSPHRSIGVAIHPTLHAERRMAQRNLSDEEIGYVLLYGQTWHKSGAIIKYLRRKDIPSAYQADQRWQQLNGATVVMATENDRMLTTYRNRRSGLRKIKRKPNYGRNMGI